MSNDTERPLLCRLGLHKWSTNRGGIKACRRDGCRKARLYGLTGTMRKMEFEEELYEDFQRYEGTESDHDDIISDAEREWPKPWSVIKSWSGGGESPTVMNPGELHMEFTDGLRGYDGTLYASVDLGSETDENRDLWLPFDVYINRLVHAESDR